MCRLTVGPSTYVQGIYTGHRTLVHGGLQAEQQVGKPGLAGTWQVVLQVAVLLSQVRFAGLGQRVAHPVVLGNQLLPCSQCVTALVVEVGGGRNVCMMKIFLCIPRAS